MKKRFTDEQIISILKEQEAGEKTADLCRRYGISPATFYKYKSKYGGMEPSDVARLRMLESENGRKRPPPTPPDYNSTASIRLTC